MTTMNIYITGLHRAGTHAFAEYKAKQEKIVYVEERTIGFNSLDNAILLKEGKVRRKSLKDGKIIEQYIPELKDGFVCQCPWLAHKVIELAKHGKVYWLTRNHDAVIASMKNGGFNDLAWNFMRDFHAEFPDDPVWKAVKYEGAQDVFCEFVGYYTLLVKMKEYFFEKYLGNYAEKIVAEEQSYFDASKTMTSKRPLKQKELDMIAKYKDHWDKVYESISIH